MHESLANRQNTISKKPRRSASRNRYHRSGLVLTSVAAVGALAALPAVAAPHAKPEKKVTLSTGLGSAWARLKAPHGLHIRNLTFTNCGDRRGLYFQPAGQPDAVGTGVFNDSNFNQIDPKVPPIWLKLGQGAIDNKDKTQKQATNPNFTVPPPKNKTGEEIVHVLASQGRFSCVVSFSAAASELPKDQKITMTNPLADQHMALNGPDPSDLEKGVVNFPFTSGGVTFNATDAPFTSAPHDYAIVGAGLAYNKNNSITPLLPKNYLCLNSSPAPVTCLTGDSPNVYHDEATADGYAALTATTEVVDSISVFPPNGLSMGTTYATVLESMEVSNGGMALTPIVVEDFPIRSG